ncbi:hypothetical protein MAE02_31720 [Microvirga aerophila]|uniref:Uncharacterized protein n=1 Tax=Microvirga aerophila TaxID=670291 RepID=A0A512BU18_9HYPH|nr:hypothetical protein MAE02_31720 [Microvirga aerophila]
MSWFDPERSFSREASFMDLKQAQGLLVNYLYAFDEIEKDHRVFTRKGLVAHSPHSLAG